MVITRLLSSHLTQTDPGEGPCPNDSEYVEALEAEVLLPDPRVMIWSQVTPQRCTRLPLSHPDIQENCFSENASIHKLQR